MTLIKHRRAAFHRQHGFCCYCTLPMWEHDRKAFASLHGLTESEAESLKSTAEHLHARRDGGDDYAQNIAAACHSCNKDRHALGEIAPTAEDYFDYMLERMASLVRQLSSLSPPP